MFLIMSRDIRKQQHLKTLLNGHLLCLLSSKNTQRILLLMNIATTDSEMETKDWLNVHSPMM